MNSTIRHVAIAASIGFFTILYGCSASRALNQPTVKDMNVLQVGTDRDLVRAELGQPIPSAIGDNCDVFAFEEGSTGWRYTRAMGYSILAVGTLGLSEIATNPIEESVGNDRIRLRVCYNAQQKVDRVEYLGRPPEEPKTAEKAEGNEIFGPTAQP